MGYGDIRDDWKLQAIEKKADKAASRLHEIDTLRCNVDSLERTSGELRSTIDGIRSEFEAFKNEIIEKCDQILAV